MTKRAFVTVGSTSFDPLIFAILDPEVLKSLQQSGYSQLTVQHGKLSKGLPDLDSHTQLNITTFDYSANITAEIDQADLVISHAGAGTVLEVLRLNKLLIVVANESLMDNHQLELAEKLVSEQYCLAAHADPISLMEKIELAQSFRPIELPAPNKTRLNEVIREEMAKLF